MKLTAMKRGVAVAVLVLVLTGCERAAENPLLGRWKSDETATLGEARDSGTVTDDQLQQLETEEVFGKLIAIIDREKIVFDYQGKQEHSPYRIVSIEEPFVNIELFNSSTKAYENTRIEMRADRILVPSAMAGFREVFVRMD